MSIDADSVAGSVPSLQNQFTAHDIAAILRERGWLRLDHNPDSAAMETWLARACDLLGPHAADRTALADLLELIFYHDATTLLKEPASQDVLAREGARDVIRELANRVLDGTEVDSDRFKQIIDAMKEAVPYRSRAMFHPVRLALAGRAGDGDLDRVILLLDSAAKLDFAVPVKNTRQRMLEFCAAFD